MCPWLEALAAFGGWEGLGGLGIGGAACWEEGAEEGSGRLPLGESRAESREAARADLLFTNFTLPLPYR